MSASGAPSLAAEAVFAPVRAQTAFEETLDRLGTAIRLGLLVPGERLPAERELCGRLGIARSTLRQALTALGQSGHLVAVRGRGGGTFVAERPPGRTQPTPAALAAWREVCDERLALEVGIVVLAIERADDRALEPLGAVVDAVGASVEDFPAYRRADVRFHVGLAEATGNRRLITATTEGQARVGDLISLIPHPPEVLEHANAQHRRLLDAVLARRTARAVAVVTEHLQGTEHVLAGLLPLA